jgi:tetratricopeptide (TPR) repeat protein
MRAWWLVLILSFAPLDGLQRIRLRNQYAIQAEAAFSKKQFLQAAALFEKVKKAEGEAVSYSVQMNLAHSYFNIHDYSRAAPLYRQIFQKSDPQQQAVINTQLAVIEAEEGNYTKALNLCKQALKLDEANQYARYNFELLQKYLILHPEKRKNLPPPQRQQRQPGAGGSPQAGNSTSTPTPTGGNGQSNTSQEGTAGGSTDTSKLGQTGAPQEQALGNSPGNTRGQSNEGGDGTNTASLPKGSNQAAGTGDALLQTRFNRLQKMKLSPEKARQLLDAMRAEESQYLQQLPSKRPRTKRTNGPDW